jgi:hypothetical protein
MKETSSIPSLLMGVYGRRDGIERDTVPIVGRLYCGTLWGCLKRRLDVYSAFIRI